MADTYRPDDSSSWRQEVASRVDTYRARRGRPRPTDSRASLELQFEPPAESPGSDDWAAPDHADQDAVVPGTGDSEYAPPPPRHTPPKPRRAVRNIIEFPSAGRLFDELAEPITDAPPRILEAAPAASDAGPAPLAGITLDNVAAAAPEDGLLDVPLQPAPLGLRATAGAVDALCVLAAAALFAAIAAYLDAFLPDSRLGMLFAVGVLVFFWCGYQYLFLVYGGNTPGKRAAGLMLATFEGEPVSRSLRRQRALASMLSCASVGLGILWALVDEDTLCWHDRITRTCVTTVDAVEPSR